MRAFRSALLAAATAALAAVPAAANDSAYTTIPPLEACVTLDSHELGGVWQCPGYRGYGLLFQEFDLRQSLFAGHVGAWFRGGAYETFGEFNSIGSTVEWRLDDRGVPLAIIVRFIIDSGQSPVDGQVLVVIRVGQPGDGYSCVVGYVDARANADANMLARALADNDAHDFACGYNEPFHAGARGPLAGTPNRYFPPVEPE